jgi:hypothetical protein
MRYALLTILFFAWPGIAAADDAKNETREQARAALQKANGRLYEYPTKHLRFGIFDIGFPFDEAALVHLKPFTELRSVNLNGGHITDKGLVHLKGLKKLQDLLLVNTEVDGSGLAHLKDLDGLTLLYMGHSEFTGEDMECIKVLKNLTVLGLQGPVTDKGLAHVAGLKNLKHLILSPKAKVTADSKKRLLKALPNLEIKTEDA